MFSSNPVYSHLALMKKAVVVPLADLKAGKANALHVDCIREVTSSVENNSVVVRRVFIDTPKSDRFLEVGWVLNEGITGCLGCHKDFGTFTRRHHCRGCGTLMCKSCSYYAMLDGFPTLGKQIVCSRCFGATTTAVKLVNKLNWGETVYTSPNKVFVPNSPVPAPAVVEEPVTVLLPVEEPIVPEEPKGPPETLEVVPTPGFVIRTARLTEGHKAIFINVYQHSDVMDTDLALVHAPAVKDSTSESLHTATTTETKGIAQVSEYEQVNPVMYCAAPTTALHRGQEVVLYNVLVSSAYFKTDPTQAEGVVSVIHPTSANKIIQVVNQIHKANLFHFTFSLPNPLNGYVGAEITEPVTFTLARADVNCISEREINLAEEHVHSGSTKSEVSALSGDNQSSVTETTVPRTPSSKNSGKNTIRSSMKKRGSFLFKSSGIALVGPEHMVLNLAPTDTGEPDNREISFAANEELKLLAVTQPRVLLGYQVILPYPDDRTDHTLTEADQENVYVITDVRKDAAFHTEFKLSLAGADKSRWERLKRNADKHGETFRITAKVLTL